jgi:hypothetical protein
MVSNSLGDPFQWLKRAHYRDFPRDPQAAAGQYTGEAGEQHTGEEVAA